MQLSRDALLEAYRSMKTIREFEERVAKEFATGDLPGFVHLYAGEEASAVGVCSHLVESDQIISTHRGHGHCIAKGCEVEPMMLELFGREGGLCGGKGGSMHVADLSKGMMGANAIVGGGPPLACGAAMTAKIKKTGGVAVSFTGDGGSNQGTTLESMNLASVMQLPVVFVFENNGFAESTAANWSVAGGSIVRRAEAFAMPGVQIDGTDFFAVHEAAGEAIERARKGGGPSLIEVALTRFYGHHQGDNQSYRTPDEVRNAREERCPLINFRRRVTEASLLDAAELDAIDAEILDQMDAATAAARAAPWPDVAEVLTDVYVTY
ncbi:MAG: thiamine pyrophosphate-dependent dehydrogenase E1 component subunit alpha [Rhodospirillaceae bacterium]|jgi:acetoin:2,6-dichlorophenolindophenol oxidoreductase subunit alpha|nr:thiamine pyrophosphate-dependent dehydrogenase E1 component subunit alpha [Rhodospirillaceae bacterium]